MMNLFKMSELYLRETNKKITEENIIEYAYIIRKWIDFHPKAVKYILGELEFKSPQSKHFFKKKYKLR